MAPPPSGPAGPTARAFPTSRPIRSTNGVTLALWDLGGSGPPLLLCHPTGFHGLVWAPVASELADVVHAMAPDLRGHGDSSGPDSGSFDWSGMADDVLAVTDSLGLGDGKPLVGAGHSMGGTALLLAEQARPGLFASLWCFEPIVLPRTGRAPAGFTLAEAARRRRSRFPDHQAALSNYASKPPLRSLSPEALRAYVMHGFAEVEGNGVELKCAPETEALCFEAGFSNSAFAHLGEVRCPVTVVAGGDGGFPARVAPEVAERLPRGRLERLEDLTHFGPMEDPVAVAASIRSGLAG